MNIRQKKKQIYACNFYIGSLYEDKDLTFVDKSFFIAEVLDHSARILHFVRPPGFGKAFNLKMLRHFLQRKDSIFKDSIFHSLKIWSLHEGFYQRFQGKYSVINLKFDALRIHAYESMEVFIKKLLEIVRTYDFTPDTFQLEQPDVRLENKEKVLFSLIDVIARRYNKRVFLSIEDVDQPLIHAHNNGFYNDMWKFFISLFTHSFKHPSLEKVIFTSVFPLPNSPELGINTFSVLDNEFNDSFGFTEKELREEMIDPWADEKKAETLYQAICSDQGYYNIGGKKLFRPLSVISQLCGQPPIPYIERYYTSQWYDPLNHALSASYFKEAREILLAGGVLEKKITINKLLFCNPRKDCAHIIGLMLMCGLLTAEKQTNLFHTQLKLAVPNKETFHFIENYQQNSNYEEYTTSLYVSNDNEKFWLDKWIKLNESKQEINNLKKNRQRFDFFIKIFVVCSVVFIMTVKKEEMLFFLAFALLFIWLRKELQIQADSSLLVKQFLVSDLASAEQRIDDWMQDLSKKSEHVKLYLKQQRQLAFLSGLHPRLGKRSILNSVSFFKHPLYDENLVKEVFDFVGGPTEFLPIKNKF